MEGAFFKRLTDDDGGEGLEMVKSYFSESSLHDPRDAVDIAIPWLEMVCSSEKPTLRKFDGKGQPVYRNEIRDKESIEKLTEIQSMVIAYCMKIAGSREDGIKEVPSPDFVNRFFVLMDENFSDIKVEKTMLHIDDGFRKRDGQAAF